MSDKEQVTPRTVWKGQLTLGLLALPVRFVSAARTETVTLNQLHRKDRSRLKQVWYCAGENLPVAKEDIVKGYEVEDGKYVLVEDEDLKRAAPESTRIMEIVQFVRAAHVDPIYFDSSYYLAPGEGGEKPYALLYSAMRKTRCFALTKIAMHSREHLAILRPGPRGIILQTLFYHDEIRSTSEFRTDTELAAEQELDLACRLVRSRVAKWKPEDYKDSYRENLLAFIHAKAAGKQFETTDAKPAQTKSIDILEALRLSVEANSK